MKKKKENSEINDETIKNKVKFSEKFSLTFRKRILVDKTKTFLLVSVLVLSYITLMLWMRTVDLPQFDITENKIYTLSKTSKDAVGKIEQEIKIYVYGFREESTLVDLLKQYNKANEKITYEIITEENNLEMVQENELSAGYYVLILKCGDTKKIIDASNDFYTYDYTTFQQIDTTEQSITNALLSLTEENKPKLYFTKGHKEFSQDQIQVLLSYLNNEGFDVEFVNLATLSEIPEECNSLVVLSPTEDFLDSEVQLVKNYINRGGNIYISMNIVEQDKSLINIQSILDEYGVTYRNGYILEYDKSVTFSEAPYIFMPIPSSTNKITADIYTDSFMWLVYSGKLQFKDEETLNSLNITKETLLSSSDQVAFITDLASDFENAAETAEVGKAEIASLVTKNITTTDENGEEKINTSNLVVVASSTFISDWQVSALSSNYPLSYLGSNKDFVINSLAFLGDKGNTLTIRKDMANSTYMPTQTQNTIVLLIIIGVPVFLICLGVLIWTFRKRRK